MSAELVFFPEPTRQVVIRNSTETGGLGTLPKLWRARIQHRAMLRRELLTQPDSVLADAGLTRAQAEAEAAKPFWRV